MPVVAVVPVHVVVATVEVQVVRVQSIAPVRRRTPIVAVVSGVVERRPVTPTGGRNAFPAIIYTEKRQRTVLLT